MKTTPQPTLEERIEKIGYINYGSDGSCLCEPLQFDRDKIKSLLLEIDQEAYERGWKGGVEDMEIFYKNYKEEVFTTQERNRILGLIEGQEVSEQDIEMAVDNLYHERKGYNQALDDLKNLIIKE